MVNIPRSALVLILIACCACGDRSGAPAPRMTEVLLTSEAGHKMASVDTVPFREGGGDGTVVTIHPEQTRQIIEGIGSSFTESAAFVLAHLKPSRRMEVMERIYGPSGANFSMARTHIGSCDFTVHGKYSYADTPGDRDLAGFSIGPDLAGFDPDEHPGVQDADYDLLPMILEAQALKRKAGEPDLKIIASAWTAPPWMKDIETWYIEGSAENDWQGSGGWLKPEYVSTYADYLLAYLEAYREEGVEIWGLTPVNEPHGNGGNWESMHFTPQTQRDFIKHHLGPKLEAGGHSGIRLLMYDQNRDGLEAWADAIYGDPESARYVYGAAVHWYSSTVKVYEEVFDRVRERYPGYCIIHTEGCIDDLGKDPPAGVLDPVRFKESGWFGNDAFWWNPNATDWAYSVTWAGIDAVDHPPYTPVHRYARDLIVGLNHGVSGWVDWNVVLDRRGGPNHVGNYCGAPVMIDTGTGEVYYTPVYHVLAQFSRTIRPGDQAVLTELETGGLDVGALVAGATINGERLLSVQLLNTTRSPIRFNLQIGDRYAEVEIPANAVQTVRVQL